MWICTMKNDISLRITLDSCVHLIIEEKKTINQIVGQITNIQLALKQLRSSSMACRRIKGVRKQLNKRNLTPPYDRNGGELPLKK
ncbi:hypothetical protein NC652_021822 [Populus alba x Populus x berolinensis]|nr:hypothetical protein NC652_021822 [Populus alba x Populus x berolinensis]